MKKENIVLIKSFDFSLSVIGLYKQMVARNEYVLSKQLLRSGTSIGANLEEAMAGISKRDLSQWFPYSLRKYRNRSTN